MRILIFCAKYYPAVGGAERQAEMLAEAYVAQGATVQVVTQCIDSHSKLIEKKNGVDIERLRVLDLSEKIKFPGVGLLNIPFVFFQFFFLFLFRARKFDVVHAHIGSLQTAAAAFACKILNKPIYVTAHTANWHSDLGNLKSKSRSGFIVSAITRSLIMNWVAISDAVIEQLVAAGVKRARITKIPNGVPIVPEALTQLKDGGLPHRFLYLGRLSSGANRDLPTLIRAFESLSKEVSNAELAIVGDGDLFLETKRIVSSSSCSSKITMPGFADPRVWLDWAHCFVLPSRFEGFSVALLEAMAAGLSCIANDIPPNREALDNGNAGILVSIGDEDMLFNAMKRLCNDGAYYNDMRNAALHRVAAHYSLNVVANKYMKIFEAKAR
jgi:glycosyltransferase involved in cell wall biosynthesis